jgi:streptogramin lyase
VTRKVLLPAAIAVPVAIAAALVLGAGVGEGKTAAKSSKSSNFIQGRVVSGRAHAEAGVWVIAETRSLPTLYRKIVVTDGRGRFVLPELPAGKYSVWVRGYGLRDSAKVSARPGATLSLRAPLAANKRQAAQIYPANYWLSLLNPPTTTAAFAGNFKLGCELCHQMGSTITRSLTAEGYDAGLKKAAVMNGTAVGLGRDKLVAALADWSARIRQGETPPSPPRPKGIERNVVLTEWGWGGPFSYAHDEIATDKRNPRVNAGGKVYGVDLAQDKLLVVDPKTNTASQVNIPTAGGFNTPWCNQTFKPLVPTGQPDVAPQDGGFGTLGCPSAGGQSAFVGKYDNPANPHNPMMDAQGRVWMTTQIRREWSQDLPAFCQGDPVLNTIPHHRQLGYYDPKTGKVQLIDTCFGTHHLQFDRNGVLWMSGDIAVLGWIDPRKFDPNNPASIQNAEQYAQMKIDTDGDGVADKPIIGFNYGIIPNPVDGSVWTAQPSVPGQILRFDPATGKFEAYSPPAPGSGPRGLDVDSQGHIWVGLGGSGHLAEFDRSKCHQTFGAGNQCPEGWTIYKSPGPLFRTGPGEPQTNADFHYYVWVDQFNTLGMGKDTVILEGTGSDSLLAFRPSTKTFTTIRLPYPLVTFMRGVDGRIDNPNTGWKGRGLWVDNGLDPLIHSEVDQSYIAHVQLRPNPLAK